MNPPSTEPGRILLDGILGVASLSVRSTKYATDADLTQAILAIEEAARDEGRREAVREIRENIEGLDYDHQNDHVVLRWIDIAAILDRVAGLNASESANIEHLTSALGAINARGGSPPVDTSESPPTCNVRTPDGPCPKHGWDHRGRGDASESGQPPDGGS